MSGKNILSAIGVITMMIIFVGLTISLVIDKSRKDLNYQVNNIPNCCWFEEDLEDKVMSILINIEDVEQEYRDIYVTFNVTDRMGKYIAHYFLETKNVYHHWKYIESIYYIDVVEYE